MAVKLNSIQDLKMILREADIPFFSDEELEWYVSKFGSYNDAAYELLLVKAENTSVNITGMTTEDTSSYFRAIASRYKPRNTGVLK